MRDSGLKNKIMLIPFDRLIRKHHVNITGVLHCGASTGQEAKEYAKLGVENMVFIEADPDVYVKLKANVVNYPKAIPINALLSDTDNEEVQFNIANNGGQSSSMLQFGTHREAHPEVHFVGSIPLTTKRLDTLIGEFNLNVHEFNFLNMDLQGAELLALRGLGDQIRYFKYAYLEVNQREVYQKCPKVEDIDMYLIGYGFRRVETAWSGNHGWGDALYIRK
jgi:FkbM family methyltransferase